MEKTIARSTVLTLLTGNACSAALSQFTSAVETGGTAKNAIQIIYVGAHSTIGIVWAVPIALSKWHIPRQGVIAERVLFLSDAASADLKSYSSMPPCKILRKRLHKCSKIMTTRRTKLTIMPQPQRK